MSRSYASNIELSKEVKNLIRKYEEITLEEISLIFENKYGLNSKIIQNLFHYLKRIEIELLRDNGVEACIIDIEKLTVDVVVLLEVLTSK